MAEHDTNEKEENSIKIQNQSVVGTYGASLGMQTWMSEPTWNFPLFHGGCSTRFHGDTDSSFIPERTFFSQEENKERVEISPGNFVIKRVPFTGSDEFSFNNPSEKADKYILEKRFPLSRSEINEKRKEYENKESNFKLKKNDNYTFSDVIFVMDITGVTQRRAIEKLDLFLGDVAGAIINLKLK